MSYVPFLSNLSHEKSSASFSQYEPFPQKQTFLIVSAPLNSEKVECCPKSKKEQLRPSFLFSFHDWLSNGGRFMSSLSSLSPQIGQKGGIFLHAQKIAITVRILKRRGAPPSWVALSSSASGVHTLCFQHFSRVVTEILNLHQKGNLLIIVPSKH